MSHKLKKRENFWDSFDNLFESMDKMFDKFPDFPAFTGYDIAKKGTDVSVTTYKHDGKSVEIRTENGKTIVKVNGELFVPQKKDKKS